MLVEDNVVTDIKFIYFNLEGGRGTACRLALHIAGARYEDVRVDSDWGEVKPTTPFGSLPVLEVAGKGRIGQSNAILTYLGRRFELHPADLFEAARHESIIASVEEAMEKMAASNVFMEYPEQRKAHRLSLAAGYLQTWATKVCAHIGDEGPFFAGTDLHIVDLKLYEFIWSTKNNQNDFVPPDIFDGHPKLIRVYAAVDTHPKVRNYFETRNAQS